MFKKSFFNPSSAMMLALAKRCGVVYSKRHVNFGSVLSLELAGMGVRADPRAGDRGLAAAVPDPFADGFRVGAEFGAAPHYRPARRDYAVGGLAPEFAGVPGGWV